MKIIVDESPVGSGKTYSALTRLISEGGKWLFVVERIASIAELVDLTEKISHRIQSKPKIISISSETAGKRGGSVRTQIEALPTKYQAGNLVALCTHEAFLKCDFRAFVDWHLICDEIPSTLHVEKMETKLDKAFFERYFKLHHVHGDWSLIKPTAEGRKLNGSDLTQCSSHKHLRKLHETAVGFDAGRTTQAPLCNLKNWSEMESDNVTWVWWSQFSFAHLAPFKSTRILASRFRESFAYSIAKNWNPEIEWETAPALPARPFNSRNVAVRYFCDQGRAAKSFFASDAGRSHLVPIAKYISRVCASDKLIWSCNDSSRKILENHLPKASHYAPRQAGTSLLMSHTSAAMIYAAKPSHEIKLMLKAIAETEPEWIRTVEYETIIQFVSRTSVRDANSSEDVWIYVYDKEQGEAVANFFRHYNHYEVDLEHIDLGLPTRTKPRGAPRVSRSPEEAAQVAEAHKRKKIQRQRERRALKKSVEASP